MESLKKMKTNSMMKKVEKVKKRTKTKTMKKLMKKTITMDKLNQNLKFNRKSQRQ